MISKNKVNRFAGFVVPAEYQPFYAYERTLEFKSNRRFFRVVADSRARQSPDPREYDALNEALAKLPVSHYLVVVRWAEGETVSDIARDWGVTKQAVSKKFVAGLERLRELLR